MRQISVVYTCCKAQEYWPITENGELEMEHSELGATCGSYSRTYQERMDDLRRERDEAIARATRLRVELLAVMPNLPRHIRAGVLRNLHDGDLAPADTEGTDYHAAEDESGARAFPFAPGRVGGDRTEGQP